MPEVAKRRGDLPGHKFRGNQWTRRLAVGLLSEGVTHGGATVNTHWKDGAVTDGIAVSEHEERSFHKPLNKVSISDITSWMNDNDDLFKKGAKIGAWVDGKNFWLDPVTIFHNQADAIEAGREHNQKAIFDIGNMVEIPTGGSGNVRKGAPSKIVFEPNKTTPEMIVAWLQEQQGVGPIGPITKKVGVSNPKSTPKEIVGHHGHHPHGKSILWPALYEHLKAKGMTKRKAAMISNGLWRKKHGLPPKSARAIAKEAIIAKLNDTGGGGRQKPTPKRAAAGQRYGSADAADRSLTRSQRPQSPRPAAPAPAPSQQAAQQRNQKRKRKTTRKLSNREMKQRKDAAQKRKRHGQQQQGRRRRGNTDQRSAQQNAELKAFYDKVNNLPDDHKQVVMAMFDAINNKKPLRLDKGQKDILMRALDLNGVPHTSSSFTTAGGRKISITTKKSKTVSKRDVGTKERENLASKGKALPDGSFPIASVQDLRNAISAYGRAKDKEAAKAHIIRAAKRLKATNMLPDDWTVSKRGPHDGDGDGFIYDGTPQQRPVGSTVVVVRPHRKVKGRRVPVPKKRIAPSGKRSTASQRSRIVPSPRTRQESMKDAIRRYTGKESGPHGEPIRDIRPGEESFNYESDILSMFDDDTKHALIARTRERTQRGKAVDRAAKAYRKKHGIAEPKVDWDRVMADRGKAERVRAAIDADTGERGPRNEAAYKQFKQQTEEMWDILTKPESEGGLGVTVEEWDEHKPFTDNAGKYHANGRPDPYISAEEQANDVINNHHLLINRGSFFIGDNPDSPTGTDHPYMTSDEYFRFRAVHDAFGHVAIGSGFDRHGEYAAWMHHSSMYQGLGREAMSTEYHGVNSYLWTAHESMPHSHLGMLLPADLIRSVYDDNGNVIRKSLLHKAAEDKLGALIRLHGITANIATEYDNAFPITGHHHVLGVIAPPGKRGEPSSTAVSKSSPEGSDLSVQVPITFSVPRNRVKKKIPKPSNRNRPNYTSA